MFRSNVCHLRSLGVPTERVNGTTIKIFSRVVVAHNGLRVLVLGDHLHLAVRMPVVEQFRDHRPPQVVRRHVPDPREPAPLSHHLLDHAGAERPVELQRPVVDRRLEEIRLVAAAA